MIAKMYGDTTIEYNITCSDEWKMFIVAQNKDKNIMDCGLEYIEQFQTMPKNFEGHHIGEYCLYMGTHISKIDGAPYDLYAHRSNNNPTYYGTGIVFGNECSDYLSGWPMDLNDERFDVYNELFWRLYVSNLINKEVLAVFFECSFAKSIKKKQLEWINLIRKSVG